MNIIEMVLRFIFGWKCIFCGKRDRRTDICPDCDRFIWDRIRNRDLRSIEEEREALKAASENEEYWDAYDAQGGGHA